MTEYKDMKAMAPPISGFTLDAATLMAIETAELGRLVPQFYDAAELGVEPILHARMVLLEPAGVSYTMPDVTEVWFESFTGAEPTLSFPEFIKGVSCAALGVGLDDVELIKGAIRLLAERVMNGGNLPPIDSRFGPVVKECYAVITANGESMSWRNLMAFTLGAFWLLGFIIDPLKRVSKGQRSPLEFVREFVEHWSRLGYIPT
jgi:hypothetical protein